ncbi:MAG: hypothetical protein ACM31L_17815 [Actinomycetota bacterium]
MSKTAAPAKPADKEAAQRKDIVRTIKGPVVERLTKMVPAFAAYEDVYATVMASPDLLYACMQLVRKQRDQFQDLIVDEAGTAITDDDAPLRCGRSFNQIIGMVVRSGAKAYAEKRYASDNSAASQRQNLKPEARSLIEKLAALVTKKWGDMEAPKPSATAADKFYAAIKDNLDYDWQVPLIPHYAELPVKLVADLGKGLTTLHTADGIAALADIGRHSMDQARRILSDDMMREMLDTQPLAAKGVAFLGKERYEFLHGAVYEKMGERFWEMCVDCDRLEAMEEQNAKDLEQMAGHLDVLSAEAIHRLVQHLQFAQIPVFLDIAREKLGEEAFVKIFGVPGSKKLIKVFCEKIEKTKLDANEPIEDLKKKLPDVFGAYLRSPKDFEKGL